jgi:hypothetical protein
VIDDTQKLDDEILAAWMDGELPPAQADQVTSRLAREPALARRLEAMRAVDAAAVGAFRSVDERPMPERVLDLIHAGADEIQSGETSNVVRLRTPAVARFAEWPVAVAASVALAFGFALSSVLQDGAAPAADYASLYASSIPAGSSLDEAFDRGLSTEPVRLGHGRVAEPVLTFRSGDGRWCRQIRVSGNGRASDALACRRGESWEVELVTFDGAATASDGAPYAQASGGGPAAMQAAVERLLGREPPLGREEEAEIVGDEWQGDVAEAVETE